MEISTRMSIRDSIFEKFREFIKDDNQQGDTLSSVAPMQFQGTKSLASRRSYLMRLAYKPETTVAAISLLFPPEVCWAAGFTPFNWEMYASLLASHSKIIDMTNKGTAPVPRCSFINSLKGACLSGILPPPNLILSTSAFCEGIGYMFSELKDYYGKEHLHLDIPGYNDSLAMDTAAKQLKVIYHKMCDQNSIDAKKRLDNLRKAVYYSTMAKIEHQQIAEIRKKYAPLNLGLEPLQWHTVFLAMYGDESGYRIMKQLKEDVQKVAETQGPSKEGIPVAVFSLIPYGRSEIWAKLKDANAFTTFEGVNHFGGCKLLDPESIKYKSEDALFQSLVYNMAHSTMRGLSVRKNSQNFVELARDFGSKGMITFAHEHCQMLAVRLDEVERASNKTGLKSVTISGDCILGMPPGPSGIRIGTFLNSLDEQKKFLKKEKINDLLVYNHESIDTYRIGIDFGSGYSKFVQIDHLNKVIKQDACPSGIDYPHLLNEIRQSIGAGKNMKFGIAGVGGDNPAFMNSVDTQTTEISALIHAIHVLYANQSDFTVIDIGTQDVKVLKFYEPQDEPWVNTNKSCGAGTGMVLKQILERWQQTRPDITFDDLDKMAFDASNSELVNTTCGIFAVTNVVSALVKSDDEHRKQILRGVYKYIAEQAIKLLPVNERHAGKIVLTGGIARHKTLQSIFIEQGFELMPLPQQLHPQFLVAFGTALSIY